MFWSTLHVTDETDIETLENTLVDKAASENLDMEKILGKIMLAEPARLGE
jgi:hypothetical protein